MARRAGRAGINIRVEMTPNFCGADITIKAFRHETASYAQLSTGRWPDVLAELASTFK